MAQSVLDDLGVDVLPCQQRGAGVPEVVVADVGQLCAPEQGFVGAVDHGWRCRGATSEVLRKVLPCGGWRSWVRRTRAC